MAHLNSPILLDATRSKHVQRRKLLWCGAEGLGKANFGLTELFLIVFFVFVFVFFFLSFLLRVRPGIFVLFSFFVFAALFFSHVFFFAHGEA